MFIMNMVTNYRTDRDDSVLTICRIGKEDESRVSGVRCVTVDDAIWNPHNELAIAL
jgi:hypothetical protein